MKRRADLSPPLGSDGGPCRVVDRIRRRVHNVAVQDVLIEEVEVGNGLTNAESAMVYKTERENGVGNFSKIDLTPHAQFRMDLRGITVPEVQKVLAKFRVWFLDPANRKYLQDLQDSPNLQITVEPSGKVRYQGGSSGATIRYEVGKYTAVFGLDGNPISLVTAFPTAGGPDPKVAPGGCGEARRADYRAPAGELSGYRTYPSEKPTKGINAPSGDSVHHSPGESPRSDRDRAAPMRPGQKDELLQTTPGNAVFNTPGPSEPGQKIHVRSPGTPGEEYGHPFKENIMPRRTEAALFPPYNERQRKQKSESKRYYKKYYLRHRGKIRARAKKYYLRKKHSPLFKKQKKRRNSVKYGWRFNRLPSGGHRSPADRSRDYRENKKAMSRIPFHHPNYGSGNVLDVLDQSVLLEQTDPMGGEPLGVGTVPFFTFMRGVEFDTEEGLEDFFDLADADFDRDDEEDDEESLRLATFYRETFRPGDNLDPGDGVRDLGEPSPVNPILPYPDTDRNDRHPGELMNNISPTDNNPGSAKVIPEGHDFQNRMASAVRVAAKMAEILQGIDPGIASRARGITPKMKRSDPGNTVYSFAVPGSKGETYTVKVKGVPPTGSVKTLSKMDLKLSCSCDFWQYQGPEHWARAGDYLFGKPRGTADRPDAKDPQGRNRLCKHAVAVLGTVKKWPAFGKR